MEDYTFNYLIFLKVDKIIVEIDIEELSKMKIGICGANQLSHGYYFSKYLNKKIWPKNKANYVIMINRASYDPNIKEAWFTNYKGDDIVSVERLNLILSTLRKIK